jgi:hypothetical protein
MEKHLKQTLRLFRNKRTYLHYYLAGFADGESSFSVAIIKHPTQKIGWMINPCFQVYQHEKHREILEVYKEVFQEGSIYRKSGTHLVLNYSIDSQRGIIEKVIPFFDKYPLITKSENYKKFRDIVLCMQRREHWTLEGFERIVHIAYSMNQQGKGRKHPKEYILSSARGRVNHRSVTKSSETLRRTPPKNGDDKVQST